MSLFIEEVGCTCYLFETEAHLAVVVTGSFFHIVFVGTVIDPTGLHGAVRIEVIENTVNLIP